MDNHHADKERLTDRVEKLLEDKMEKLLEDKIDTDKLSPSSCESSRPLSVNTKFNAIKSNESTPIEALNLSCERKLQLSGIETVQQLEDWMLNSFRPSIYGIGAGKIDAIKKALECFDPEVGVEIREFESATPVEALKFSFVEALKSAGIDTLENLLEWDARGFDPNLKGIGKGKRLKIKDALRRIRVVDSEITFSELSRHKLSPLYAAIPTKYFHFGARSSSLSDSVGESLGDLGEWYEQGCYPVKNFGSKSTKKARIILASLYQSLNEHGIPNWEEFCALASIKIIPNEISLLRSHSVLESIPIIIDEVIEATSDDVEADILRNRLLASRLQQKTLQELADRHGVSRERIRQKEINLIEGISDGLIDEYYVGSEFRFRSEFALMWQLASEAFGDAKELDSEAFLGTLCDLWDTSSQSLIPHLSFILAVLTRRPKVPDFFKAIERYPNLLGSDLPEILTCKSIYETRISPAMAKWIEDLKILTVGELLGVIRGMPIDTVLMSIHEWLGSLESYLRNLVNIELFRWKEFFEFNGQVFLPETPIGNIGVFFDLFENSLRDIVRAGNFHQYSCELLENFFARSNHRALTLEQLGQQLSTLGVNLSRVQSVMFERLRTLLVERSFSKSQVVICESFSSYWMQIDQLYEVGDSVESLVLKLKSEWFIDGRLIDKYGKLIWKIIASSTPKRGVNLPRSKDAHKSSSQGYLIPKNFVVVLRKKRTIH
ncbi:hypothetical protein N8675_03390 [Akkermansiaceae bacterium]|nr:hypothetical protein [Akkermansiaceae bacterium]